MLCSYHKKRNNIIIIRRVTETYGSDGYVCGIDCSDCFRCEIKYVQIFVCQSRHNKVV